MDKHLFFEEVIGLQEFKKQEEDFGQSFHAAEIRYTNDAISTVDYVIAKNNFDRVHLNLVVAKSIICFGRNYSIFTRTGPYGKTKYVNLVTLFCNCVTSPATIKILLNDNRNKNY